MISEDKFCEILDNMKADDKAASQINLILKNRKKTDFADAFAIFEHNTMTVLYLLQECMHDNYGWIEWWVCETNYGSNPLKIYVDETEDSYIYLRNSHELYHFLLERFNE